MANNGRAECDSERGDWQPTESDNKSDKLCVASLAPSLDSEINTGLACVRSAQGWCYEVEK